MGKHYEAFQHTVNNIIQEYEFMRGNRNVKDYYKKLISDTELIHFPILTQEIKEKLNLDEQQYTDMLHDFQKQSHEQCTPIITPYETTAIEDSDSVVIADKQSIDTMLITSCMQKYETTVVLTGEIRILSYVMDNGDIPLIAKCDYYTSHDGKEIANDIDPKLFMYAMQDIAQSTMAFIEQAAVINHSSK